MPLTGFTAWKGLFERLRLSPGALVDAGAQRSTARQTIGPIGPINATNLPSAHAQLEGGQIVGKVVLAGWD